MKIDEFKVAILAKSNKRRNNNDYGYCIAGVTALGEWIRFVADENGDSVSQDEAIEVGQIILALGERAPLAYQTENVVLRDFNVIDKGFSKEFFRYVNNIRPIKENGIFGNAAKRLTAEEMKHNNGTLRLLEVQSLEVYWDKDKKCKALFNHNGIHFDGIPMTDPKHYTKKGSPPEYIGNACIIVSLPDEPVFNKFVAAIYPN
ncbi:hypothetical protein LJC31_06250 [Synergistaceae bacterium OttesenSCG-928-I11]|nr:hypothetical protein [Synergistaceae bacterium OttesenSCG-928-I11]